MVGIAGLLRSRAHGGEIKFQPCSPAPAPQPDYYWPRIPRLHPRPRSRPRLPGRGSHLGGPKAAQPQPRIQRRIQGQLVAVMGW